MTDAEYHQQLEQNELDWMERISPPPMPVNSTIFCVMAVRNGQFYAAPLGTPYDLNASESWLKVNSMEDIGSLLGVRHD